MSRSKRNFKCVPETNSCWRDKRIGELRKCVLEYYKENLRDLEIKNEDTGIIVRFSMTNARKTAQGGAMYHKKAEIVKILPEIIKYALYNNFGKRKETDPEEVLGFLNFKGRCKLDREVENVRLAIQFQKSAKFYYNIEVNKIL